MSIAKDAPSLITVGGISFVLTGVGAWWLLRHLSARRSRAAEIVAPAVGQTGQIATHFGPRGGYVRLDRLVLWSTLDAGSDALAPGTQCVVTSVDTSGDTTSVTVCAAGGDPVALPTRRWLP